MSRGYRPEGIAQVSHRPANKVHQDIEKSMSILMRLRAHANRGMEGGAEISASEVSTLLKTVGASLIHNEAYHVRDLMIKRVPSRKGKHKTLTRGIEAYFSVSSISIVRCRPIQCRLPHPMARRGPRRQPRSRP